MKKRFLFIPLLFFAFFCSGQQETTRLLVRIDDMGFSHAANVACIDAYQNGIAKSVEVMVPGPWFEEAAQMLNENPGLDVGVHLVLTSEWNNLKWRPLTNSPSLTDENGYFYPMIWKNEKFPPNRSLTEANWKLEEIEQELRRQIELAIKKIPQVSHLTHHMGCMNMDEKTKQLLKRLAEEYELAIFPDEHGVERMPSWSGNKFSAKEKEKRFMDQLKNLGPGDWITVEHPGYDWEELTEVGHLGYENVAIDRDGVTKVFTSKRVKNLIDKKGVVLISYKDLDLKKD